MTTNHRRIALLAGASVSALGLAMPAYAAPHDGLAAGTYAGVDTTAGTVTICDLASTVDCFFGVIDDTNPASALVNSVPTGRIYQHDAGGLVDITLINAAGDSAEVGAIALGSTAAIATLSNPIWQTATGTDVTINFQNDGALLVDAVAVATGAAAVANASATGYRGVPRAARRPRRGLFRSTS